MAPGSPPPVRTKAPPPPQPQPHADGAPNEDDDGGGGSPTAPSAVSADRASEQLRAVALFDEDEARGGAWGSGAWGAAAGCVAVGMRDGGRAAPPRG